MKKSIDFVVVNVLVSPLILCECSMIPVECWPVTLHCLVKAVDAILYVDNEDILYLRPVYYRFLWKILDHNCFEESKLIWVLLKNPNRSFIFTCLWKLAVSTD